MATKKKIITFTYSYKQGMQKSISFILPKNLDENSPNMHVHPYIINRLPFFIDYLLDLYGRDIEKEVSGVDGLPMLEYKHMKDVYFESLDTVNTMVMKFQVGSFKFKVVFFYRISDIVIE